MKRKPRFGSDERNFDDPEYIKWRASVYRRDGYACQMPGCTQKGFKNLQAHHIRRWADNPSLRYAVSNGITLCNVCHKKVTGSEESYVPLFTGITLKKTGGDDKAAADLTLRLLMRRYGKI